MTPQMIELPWDSPDANALQESRHRVSPSQAGSFRYVPAGTGVGYWGPGTQMSFIVTGKDTGGLFFLAQMTVPPGGGPPPHIHHREDESFQVLEGTLTIQVGGDTITASAGDFAYLPRGIAHAFRNIGDTTAKALVLITPAGLENYFAEVFDRVADPSAPPTPPGKELIARALAVSPRYGLELLPLRNRAKSQFSKRRST